MASLRSVLASIIAKGGYDNTLNKWNSLKDLDILMDDMSARRASGRGAANCSCNSNCVGHSAFYAEAGKLSLGDINAYISSIKGCSCDTQSSTTSSCTCNSNCPCNSQYSCSCENVGGYCDAYTSGGCWCDGDIYNECQSDYWPPGSCYGGYSSGCSCNIESCSCNSNCTCNAQSTCTCNTVCSCNGHFA